MRLKPLFRSFLPLLLAVTLLAGTAQASLLDVGPTVAQKIGSTEPNLGHGYPAWYRDSNRLPLELCLNEAMCFFAPPDSTQAVSFPGNIPDELFYWAGDAIITLPGVNQRAILVQAIEAAYATGNVVPGAQITFARMRIRIDTDRAGNYVVTTPFKQYTFTIADDPAAIADGINFTEDIGIAEGGVFTGALAGTIGPFLYCTDAPFPATDGSGGSYIGKNALTCPVQGSTFTDPVTGQPANFFRVQGPPGFGGVPSGTVETREFSVQGKLHTASAPIPTPLTVDQATYALDSAGLQVNVFATTQPLANQTETGAFPLNFTLSGVPSTLQLAAAGIPTQSLATNDPGDGKFFSASGRFAAPATLPTTVTVTNTADNPDTVLQDVPLVDEVVISAAAYNPQTKTLAITASSSDKLNAPVLQAFMPGMTEPLPGGLNIQFPVIDTTVTPNKTYAIPSSTITVTSSKGGSTTAAVSTFVPPILPATGATLTPALDSPQIAGTAVTFTAAATGSDAGPYEYRFQWRRSTNATYTNGRAYATTPTWTWDTAALGLPAGTYIIRVYARHVGNTAAAGEAIQTMSYVLNATPATGATLSPGLATPQTAGTAVTFTATATGSDAGPYEYRFQWRRSTDATYTNGRAYATTPTWTWDTAALGLPAGTYIIRVYARHVGNTAAAGEAIQTMIYMLN